MSLPIVPVTFTAYDQNGNPVAGAPIQARLDKTEIYQGFVVPELFEYVTNASGVAVLNLWPNALGVNGSKYRVRAWNPDTGLKFLDTTISVPNSACAFEQILVQEPYPPIDASEQALIAAQGALASVTSQVLEAEASLAEIQVLAEASSESAAAALSQAQEVNAALAGAVVLADTIQTNADQVEADRVIVVERVATALGIYGSTTSLQIAVQTASTAATTAVAARDQATVQADLATNRATQASSSKDSAALSATSAATSATQAQASATQAGTYNTQAGASAAQASSASATAVTSAVTAQTAATQATAGASTATTKAAEALANATSASSSATTASTKASDATTAASTATTKAAEAVVSATSASGSATVATAQASIATTKAGQAATSQSNAAASETSAAGSASVASTQASNAALSATSAQNSATAAATSSTSASNAASTAIAQADIATTKASQATVSASGAASSAATATTKASEALTSATNALAAKVSAEAARDTTLAALDNFDDRYLGQKASDPTVDNDGNALISGALYFNTAPIASGGGMRVYDAATGTWFPAYASITSGNVISALGFTPAPESHTHNYLPLAGGAVTGNVGIGPGATTHRLTVSGSGNDARIRITDIDSTYATALALQEFGGSDGRGGFVGINGGVMQVFAETAVADTVIYAGAAERLRANASGITLAGTLGTAQFNSYGDQLSFSKNGYNYLSAIGAAATLQIQATGAAGKLIFATAGGERARIDAAGNVGIGTSSPASKLHVSGVATFSDVSANSGNGLGKISYFADDGGGDNVSFGNNVVINPVSYTGTLNVVNPNHAGSAWLMGSLSGVYPESVTAVLQFAEANGANRLAMRATPSVISLYTANIERFTLDSSGNLGLGVTPSAWSGVKAFQINGFGAVTADTNTIALSHNVIGNIYSGFGAAYGTTGQPAVAYSLDKSSGSFKWYTAPSGTAGQPVSFTQAMTLDASGKLLVGTTSASTPAIAVFNRSNALSSPILTWTNSANNSGYLHVLANGAGITADGHLSLGSGESGTNGFTERARIDSSGNLLVGTAVNTVPVEQSYQWIAAAGAARFNHSTANNSGDHFSGFFYNATNIGAITQNGITAVSYNTSSDYRLKNISGPITTSGLYIDSLNPVEGTWKADGSTFVGLIAHEVQEASRTQVATGEKDGEQMQAMDYSNSELIANLIAEVKSLRARVAALEIN